MKLKPFKALALLYVASLLLATDCTCDCGEFRKYEVTYTEAKLSVWDTSKFQSKEVKGKVSKNSFGIGVNINHNEKGIAMFSSVKDNAYASFGIGMAWACDCVPPEYIINDPIASIQIRVTNTENQEEQDITANFATESYGGNGLSIKEVLEQHSNKEYFYGFNHRLDLIDALPIPTKAVFTLVVTLKSGKTFTQKTAEILFTS